MQRLQWLVFAVLGAVVPVHAAQNADSSHRFSVQDLLAMERISDPQVSPQARRVAFVVRTTDLERNAGRTDLWLVNLDGSDLRRLTTDPAGDSSPRWSPDGETLWFLSSRSGSSQIWKISITGGEAVQITHLPLDVTHFLISPDGSRLALTMRVRPGCPDLSCTVDWLKKREAEKSSGRVFEDLLIRHWDSWDDGLKSHLFILPAAGGTPVDLMKDLPVSTPSEPFGGPEEITFTPDGQGLIFTARDPGQPAAWSTDFDLYLVPTDGSEPPRCLTENNPAWDTQPTFSPDGRRLAYLAMERAGYEADRFRIVVESWPGRDAEWVSEKWDRSPSSIVWSADGTSIYAVAAHLGQTSLFELSLMDGSVRTLIEQGSVTSAAPAGDRIAFGKDDLLHPLELYSADRNGGDIRTVTRFNNSRLERARTGEAEQFTFPGWNGETVYAWLVRPADFDPARKYPVAFLIHGGPQGSFGNHFHYRWNPQVYAGAGYAAIMVDFHGSTGYGQAFTDSIRGDWGGKPLEDLQKGLAAALSRYPWMDGDRVAALGASYGGYMVNWIAGHWPEPFRCLVNHDGVFDMRMMYYATEELWFPEWEHGGPYFLNPAEHEKHNPVHAVERWKTPMLIIHGAEDFRVPLEQGIAAFTALRRRGIPSRFLYFPDENHWVLKPQNSLRWHQEVLDWLNRWLVEETPAP